jgi:acylphosphatase
MPEQETLTRRVIVEGYVQGVGFRHFAYRAATRLGLSGWVRNRVDGTVEALISGAPDKVEAMLVQLRRGPLGADVRALRLAEADRVDWKAGAFVVKPTV